jgi:hypothetical protein
MVVAFEPVAAAISVAPHRLVVMALPGGTIGVTSSPEETRFTFRIPLKSRPARPG